MVNKTALSGEVSEFTKPWRRQASGTFDRGRYKYTIIFPDPLAKQIHEEATKREWTFSHMVRHLCEASIEGIN